MSIMSYNGAAVIGARATTRATTRRARFGDSVFFLISSSSSTTCVGDATATTRGETHAVCDAHRERATDRRSTRER